METDPVIYDFNPYSLPDELVKAIGLAVTCAAHTESCIDYVIGACAGVDIEIAGAITTHMNVPLRFSVLRSLAQIKLDDLAALDELDDLIQAAEKAFEKRNEIAHYTWAIDPQTRAIILVKERARDGYEADLVPMTVDRVESDAALIYEVGLDFIKFMQTHGLSPSFPPSRRGGGEKSKAARKKLRKKS